MISYTNNNLSSFLRRPYQKINDTGQATRVHVVGHDQTKRKIKTHVSTERHATQTCAGPWDPHPHSAQSQTWRLVYGREWHELRSTQESGSQKDNRPFHYGQLPGTATPRGARNWARATCRFGPKRAREN